MSATTRQSAEATMTNTNNRLTEKAKKEEMIEEEQEEIPPLPMLLHKKDIWVGNILPFLGMGNYIFVAGICKDTKEIHGEYYSSVAKANAIPKVKFPENRKAHLTDTFYREAFASLSHAKFWDDDTKQKAYRLPLYRICQTIAKYGNVPTLEWARKEREFPWDEWTCVAAAFVGNMKTLKYAHDNGCPWDARTCTEAARAGRLDILQYAHDNGCPWNATTCASAARVGRLDILEFAHDNGCPWSESTCFYAASEGRLDILRYARDNGCPWDEGTCLEAAAVGRLDILEYAHDNGCPWDEETCKAAAEEGQLDTLRYAHENGCPWNERTCWQAAKAGRLDISSCPVFLGVSLVEDITNNNNIQDNNNKQQAVKNKANIVDTQYHATASFARTHFTYHK